MSKWQPIKTAPKDGTWVLLKGGKTPEADGRCRQVVAKFMPDYLDGHWTYAYWDSSCESIYENPTEWMPLPK